MTSAMSEEERFRRASLANVALALAGFCFSAGLGAALGWWLGAAALWLLGAGFCLSAVAGAWALLSLR